MDGDTLAVASGVVTRARTGDPKALERVYRSYHRAVYNLARRMCGNEEDAEDVVQETFLEVCRSIDGFRGEGSLWGWVRQVAASKALMHLRRERVRSTDELHEDRASVSRLSGRVERPDGAVHAVDLESALDRLTPTARAVLWLHDVEGYTHREIGSMMGKTESFSKSQLSRAHQRLRDWLE